MANGPSLSSPKTTAYLGNIPIPDPTVLTTQQLGREILALREIIESRLDGMDKAINLLSEAASRSPSIAEVVAKGDERFRAIENHIEKAHSQLKELQEQKVNALKLAHDERLSGIILTIDERFSSIATQFKERDTRTEQTSKDSKVAVDAALQAAKEAVGEQNKSNALSISKSEAAFTKQIDQIGTIITTTAKGVDDKIDDIKGRLQIIEAKTSGKEAGMSTLLGWIFGAFGLLAALSTTILAIFHLSGKI